MPNDERTSEFEYKSNQKTRIEKIQEKLINFIETSTIMSSVFGFILTTIVFYIVYQIIMIILKSCIKTKTISITKTQESTPEISKLLEQELAFLKQNSTVGIFPALPIENSHIDPPSNSLNL